MSRRVVGLCAVLLLTACGQPDAAQFAAPVESFSTATVTVSSTSGIPLPTAPTSGVTEPSVTASVSATPAVDPAVALGVTAVVPWGMVTVDDISRSVALVAGMSVAAKAGSVVMASSGTAVDSSEVGDLGLGGVNVLGAKGVLDGTAGGTPEQVAEVTAALNAQLPAAQAGFPLLIGVDQEYGDVTRLVNGFTRLPGASSLGSISDLDTAVQLTQQAASIAAAEMLAVGINLDFAPVSDVLPSRGSSAIGDRSYGTDPDRVAALVTAAVAGYQAGGVAATLKHFPGIGAIAADSHVTLSTVTTSCADWNDGAAAPVRAGVGAGVSMVMTGHTLFPAVDPGKEPTSLSTIVLTDLLRGDPGVPLAGGCEPVGFRGVSISDSVVMAPIANSYSTGEAAWRALAAGEDIVLMPASPSAAVAGITDAVAAGQLTEARLNEAAVRVFSLRSALGRSPRPDLDSVGSAANKQAAAEIWSKVE